MARVSLTELRDTYCSLFARLMILNAEKGVARVLHRCHAEVFLYGKNNTALLVLTVDRMATLV